MSDDFTQDEGKAGELKYNFYRNIASTPSEEEEESLNPILNTLKQTGSRYEIPVLIAEGGEKRIFKVYDRHLNRFVAMAQAARAENDRKQEQFLREGQLTANLTHPNIVPIHNMGIGSDSTPFFSMELVPGDSLGDIIVKLKEGDPDYALRYDLKTLLGILNKVCDAVAYAHSRGVLHLDIKPDNIRVGQFGEVFLCDWGLARIEGKINDREAELGELDGDILNDMTLTGTIKGTPGFMAPEQITNNKKSEQTDIYALGALLYLILTHHLPVAGKTATDIVRNTREGHIIPPQKRKTKERIPSSLAAVSTKALAHLPEKRYHSVQTFQSDLNRYLAGFPTKAEHASMITRIGLLAQRHRNLTIWLLAFFVLLVMVMSVNLSTIQQGKRMAEENLSLYRSEQEEAERINTKLSFMSFHTKNIMSYVSANSMIPVINQLLDQDTLTPELRQKILIQKARMLLVLQKFNEAAIAFKQIQDPSLENLKMQELCHKYGALKPNDLEPLSDHDFAKFLTTHYRILPRSLALYVYYHDRMRERPTGDPEAHIEVVGAMLARLNQINSDQIPTLKLTKRPKGLHLDLSHTPYSVYLVNIPLVYGLNILTPLELHSLDISHTPVSLVRELWSLKIKELRMVGTSLYPRQGLRGMLQKLGVERVILGKGEYPAELLQSIRASGIEVVEEEQ